MTRIVFIDTETTSLRPDRRAWEIALITRDDNGKDTEHSWFVDADDIDLGNADLMSLKIGRFFERHPQARLDEGTEDRDFDNESSILLEVEPLLRGATIVGAVPNFDTEVLSARMREHGICPSWHYHLVDIETLAAGALKLPPPWSFDTVLATFGLAYDEADRHTALGDARMVRDLYDAILGNPGREPGTVTGCGCIDANQTDEPDGLDRASDEREAARQAAIDAMAKPGPPIIFTGQ